MPENSESNALQQKEVVSPKKELGKTLLFIIVTILIGACCSFVLSLDAQTVAKVGALKLLLLYLSNPRFLLMFIAQGVGYCFPYVALIALFLLLRKNVHSRIRTTSIIYWMVILVLFSVTNNANISF